jgi:hypothetical protein
MIAIVGFVIDFLAAIVLLAGAIFIGYLALIGWRTLDAVEDAAADDVARPAGIEPATSGLEGRCSVQLSYGRNGVDYIANLDDLVRCGGCGSPLYIRLDQTVECLRCTCPRFGVSIKITDIPTPRGGVA